MRAAILSSTEFHLVTNGEVAPDSLAARIHAAETAVEADSVANELLTMAPRLRQDLLPYAEKVRALAHLLSTFVGKVFVLDRVSATFGGNLQQLPSLRLLGSVQRTEERRVGKECRSRWSPYH